MTRFLGNEARHVPPVDAVRAGDTGWTTWAAEHSLYPSGQGHEFVRLCTYGGQRLTIPLGWWIVSPTPGRAVSMSPAAFHDAYGV